MWVNRKLVPLCLNVTTVSFETVSVVVGAAESIPVPQVITRPDVASFCRYIINVSPSVPPDKSIVRASPILVTRNIVVFLVIVIDKGDAGLFWVTCLSRVCKVEDGMYAILLYYPERAVVCYYSSFTWEDCYRSYRGCIIYIITTSPLKSYIGRSPIFYKIR